MLPRMASRARSSTPRRRRAYHHGDLRRSLLETSLQVIEQEGVSRLSLREVARRAGVSHAAPKHHFGDLRGLHCAIAEQGYRKLAEHMARARDAAPGASPLLAFQRMGVAYVEFATRHPGHFRAMFHPEVADRSDQPALEQAAEAAYALLLDAMGAAQAAGEVRPHGTRELALGAWSMVHGLAALAVDRQLEGKGLSAGDAVALARELTDQLYLGLRPDLPA